MIKEHEEIQQLLPWYVNESLAGKDLDLVLRHLADCKECQSERDRLYELQKIVRESDSSAPGYEMSYRRTMKRIEAAERNRESTEDIGGFLTGKRGPSAGTWFGLAASFLAVAITTLILTTETRTGDEFQALSSDVPSIGTTMRLELMFAHPIPATTMRQALIETNSNIVSGPDTQGNYLVEVTVPNNMTTDEFLLGIRDIDGVTGARFIDD